MLFEDFFLLVSFFPLDSLGGILVSFTDKTALWSFLKETQSLYKLGTCFENRKKYVIGCMPRQLTIDKLGYEIAVKSIFNIQIEVLLTFFCFLLTIYCWSLQEVTVIDFFGETNYEPPTPPGGNKKEEKDLF